MEETEAKDLEANDKMKKPQDGLPICTTAASAEHARAENEDEPCDDGRAGTGNEKKD